MIRNVKKAKNSIENCVIVLCNFQPTGGRIKALVEGLQMIALSKHNQKKSEMRFSGNYVLPSTDMIKGRISLIKNDFYKHIKVNKKFARCLIACELMNLVNIVVQIYVTNIFLAGQFYSLGFNFMEDDFTGPMDVLDTVFPKVTKCDFYKYGASGSLQRHGMTSKMFLIWFVMSDIMIAFDCRCTLCHGA